VGRKKKRRGQGNGVGNLREAQTELKVPQGGRGGNGKFQD